MVVFVAFRLHAALETNPNWELFKCLHGYVCLVVLTDLVHRCFICCGCRRWRRFPSACVTRGSHPRWQAGTRFETWCHFFEMGGNCMTMKQHLHPCGELSVRIYCPISQGLMLGKICRWVGSTASGYKSFHCPVVSSRWDTLSFFLPSYRELRPRWGDWTAHISSTTSAPCSYSACRAGPGCRPQKVDC